MPLTEYKEDNLVIDHIIKEGYFNEIQCIIPSENVSVISKINL